MRSLAALFLFALLAACSGLSPEEAASLAARGYYQHLMAGEYEQFLEGKNGADTLPAAYREELLTAYKQFARQQEWAHGGIASVEATNAVVDTTLHCTNVFLMLNYADSLSEEIVVPMVEADGRWRMK